MERRYIVLSKINHLDIRAVYLLARLVKFHSVDLKIHGNEPYIRALRSSGISKAVSSQHSSRMILILTHQGAKFLSTFMPSISYKTYVVRIRRALWWWWCTFLAFLFMFLFCRKASTTMHRLLFYGFPYTPLRFWTCLFCTAIVIAITANIAIHDTVVANRINYNLVCKITLSSFKHQLHAYRGLAWTSLLLNLFTSIPQTYNLYGWNQYYWPIIKGLW